MSKLATIHIVDEIELIVDLMRAIGTISNISVLNGVSTITTNKTKNFTYAGNIIKSSDLVDGDEVAIGGVKYIVYDVTDTTFKVSGTASGTTWKRQAPYFNHGTPLTTDKERKLLKQEGTQKLQYPFIALFEPTSYQININDNDREYQRFSLWMVFMTYNNISDNNSNTNLTNVQKPMEILANDFVYLCKMNPDFLEISSINAISHANYGIVAKTIGGIRNIITENLGGVEYDKIEIKTIKKYECNG